MSASSGAPSLPQRRLLCLGERPSLDVTVREDNESAVISLTDLQMVFSLFHSRLNPCKKRPMKIDAAELPPTTVPSWPVPPTTEDVKPTNVHARSNSRIGCICTASLPSHWQKVISEF
jgi:hypothetical protein